VGSRGERRSAGAGRWPDRQADRRVDHLARHMV